MLCSCLFVEALTKYKICFIAIHNAICRHQLETSHSANLAKEMYTSRGWLGFAPHEILRFVKETHIKRKYENSCLFKAFMNMSICASSKFWCIWRVGIEEDIYLASYSLSFVLIWFYRILLVLHQEPLFGLPVVLVLLLSVNSS